MYIPDRDTCLAALKECFATAVEYISQHFGDLPPYELEESENFGGVMRISSDAKRKCHIVRYDLHRIKITLLSGMQEHLQYGAIHEVAHLPQRAAVMQYFGLDWEAMAGGHTAAEVTELERQQNPYTQYMLWIEGAAEYIATEWALLQDRPLNTMFLVNLARSLVEAQKASIIPNTDQIYLNHLVPSTDLGKLNVAFELLPIIGNEGSLYNRYFGLGMYLCSLIVAKQHLTSPELLLTPMKESELIQLALS